MLSRSTIQLLRFHFSLFLLPVFLFAISQLPQINWFRALAVFIVLHLLVYPSSNGYNSYMDRDVTPIGGLASPLPPTRQLFTLTVLMDLMAILLSLFISLYFSLGILLYILASRAYSWRRIRLKQFPLAGFMTVFIFQGAVIFFITWHAVHPLQPLSVPVLPCLISSLLIGALYPLTQVYQHDEDRNDGVITISYLAGKKGTFILSMVFFLAATISMYLWLRKSDQANQFLVFLALMLPLVFFFLFWMMKVWKNDGEANFSNSLKMNVVSTCCTTAYFITLIILNH